MLISAKKRLNKIIEEGLNVIRFGKILTQKEIADRCGVSEAAFSNLINKKRTGFPTKVNVANGLLIIIQNELGMVFDDESLKFIKGDTENLKTSSQRRKENTKRNTYPPLQAKDLESKYNFSGSSIHGNIIDRQINTQQYIHHNDGIVNFGMEQNNPEDLCILPSPATNPLQGRFEEIVKLGELLEKERIIVCIEGEKGIGKTALAKEYLDTYQHKYKHIAWLDVGPEISIQQAFSQNAQLLDSLMLGQNALTQDPSKQEQTFQLCLNAMRSLKGKNLLLLDDVDDNIEDSRLLNSLQLLFPSWKIVITTEIENLQGTFSPLKLGPLKEGVALELFAQHFEGKTQAEKTRKIFELANKNTGLFIKIAQRAKEQRWKQATIIEMMDEFGSDFLMPKEEIAASIELLLKENELEEAIKKLVSFTHLMPSLSKEIQVYANQYEELKRRIESNKIAMADRKVLRDRITSRLIVLLKNEKNNV